MKRTIFPILVVFLTCGIAVVVNRRLLNNQTFQSGPVKPASDPIAKKTNTVSYKGVRFTFDPCLASEIKSETIPANVDGKPCDIVPEHPAFTFVGYPLPRGMPDGDPQIRILPITKFREAMHKASAEMAKVTEPPMEDWVPWFDDEVRTLKVLIAEKPTRINLKSVIAKPRRGMDCSEMPFLPMWEACQAFLDHLRYVNFKNGKGVFFLTQWDTETEQITNQGLEYAFQGISNDGQYYVYAEFSVAAPFLPMGDEPEVIAWDEKNYLLPHQSKAYQSYLQPVLAKLEALPPDKFQPNLELIEKLIRSLEIQKQ